MWEERVPGGKAERQPQKIELAEGKESRCAGKESSGVVKVEEERVPGGRAERQPQKIELAGGKKIGGRRGEAIAPGGEQGRTIWGRP